MTALEFGGELMVSERPTIPMPEGRESGVRMNVEQLPICAATVDMVVCDLSRDPRSESYIPSHKAKTPQRSGLWSKDHDALVKCGDEPSQNERPHERPPSTSTVLALK